MRIPYRSNDGKTEDEGGKEGEKKESSYIVRHIGEGYVDGTGKRRKAISGKRCRIGFDIFPAVLRSLVKPIGRPRWPVNAFFSLSLSFLLARGHEPVE